eukprot:CAMPEP_0170249894 /NCGR_PEP_ID=MMETSP0116_2-20130129/24757_1 /TAXON_ID=400756 /ORGANISM="Durinskia baltica, Strain CSIRO CS-38" /LENGTH=117 /DNA_ID=CAMNT_0010500817 /DNA_START=41 /DNA_END=391 /DNA_ORIENTATION=-
MRAKMPSRNRRTVDSHISAFPIERGGTVQSCHFILLTWHNIAHRPKSNHIAQASLERAKGQFAGAEARLGRSEGQVAFVVCGWMNKCTNQGSLSIRRRWTACNKAARSTNNNLGKWC